MSFKKDHPNYKTYTISQDLHLSDVPSSAWAELESLIESAGEDHASLAKVVIELSKKVRAGFVENGFARDYIPQIVSKIHKKTDDGDFPLFMDCLAILVDEGVLDVSSLNEFLSDNDFGYRAGKDMFSNGVYWDIVDEEGNILDPDEIERTSAEIEEDKEEVSLPPQSTHRTEEQIDKMETKIFISHASKDKQYLEAFIDLLNGLHVPEESVVCTSVEGHRIPNGANIYDWLREQFKLYKLHMIYALSSNYYDSVPCLNEMGAAWVTGTKNDLLLLPGFSYSMIKGCLSSLTVGIKLDADEGEVKERLNMFKDALTKEFNLQAISEITWERIRNKFILRIQEIKKEGQDKVQIDNVTEQSVKIENTNKEITSAHPIPKFEVSISSYNGDYQNLNLHIRNVSHIIVSGLKGISFDKINNLGNKITCDVNGNPIPDPKNILFEKRSLSAGEETTIKMDNPPFFMRNKVTAPDGTLNLIGVAPKNLHVVLKFSCEDEYGKTLNFKAETIIPDTTMFHKDVWDCVLIA